MNKITCICLGVGDMERAIKFYKDGLGYKTDCKEDNPPDRGFSRLDFTPGYGVYLRQEFIKTRGASRTSSLAKVVASHADLPLKNMMIERNVLDFSF